MNPNLLLILFSLSWPLAQDPGSHRHHMPQLHQDSAAYLEMLEDPSRDAYQKPDQLVEALQIEPGEVIADIGSGSGYFTVRLAKAVGSQGRVYAVDVNPDMVRHLNRRRMTESLWNIETVLADADDPLLPPQSVDRFFICNTWHHIDEQSKYLERIKQILSQDGQVIMIDFKKKELPVGPPVGMKIRREDLIQQMRNAEFELLAEHHFLPHQYFLVFRPNRNERY